MMGGVIFQNYSKDRSFFAHRQIFFGLNAKHIPELFRFRNILSFCLTIFFRRLHFLGPRRARGGPKFMNWHVPPPALTTKVIWDLYHLRRRLHCVFIVDIEPIFQVNDCSRRCLYCHCDDWSYAHITGFNICSCSRIISS
jgi:hypothetical protein